MSVGGELERTIEDALSLCAETEKEYGRSRAIALVRTKLDEAMLWLSQVEEPARDGG